MSVYQTVADAVRGVLPRGWEFVDFEAPIETAPDTTRVTLKIRTVTRLPSAPIGAYQVDWILTVTTQYTDREIADPDLFDDLLDFLGALDTIGPWLGWTEATKDLNESGVLLYDINVQTHTQKEA